MVGKLQKTASSRLLPVDEVYGSSALIDIEQIFVIVDHPSVSALIGGKRQLFVRAVRCRCGSAPGPDLRRGRGAGVLDKGHILLALLQIEHIALDVVVVGLAARIVLSDQAVSAVPDNVHGILYGDRSGVIVPQKDQAGVIFRVFADCFCVELVLAGDIIILRLRLPVLKLRAVRDRRHSFRNLRAELLVGFGVSVSLDEKNASVVFDRRIAVRRGPFRNDIGAECPYVCLSGKISLTPLDPCSLIVDQRVREDNIRRVVGNIADPELIGPAALSRIGEDHFVRSLLTRDKVAVIADRPAVLTLILLPPVSRFTLRCHGGGRIGCLPAVRSLRTGFLAAGDVPGRFGHTLLPGCRFGSPCRRALFCVSRASCCQERCRAYQRCQIFSFHLPPNLFFLLFSRCFYYITTMR